MTRNEEGKTIVDTRTDCDHCAAGEAIGLRLSKCAVDWMPPQFQPASLREDTGSTRIVTTHARSCRPSFVHPRGAAWSIAHRILLLTVSNHTSPRQWVINIIQ